MRIYTAVIIRAEKAAKMTQRSLRTNIHIRWSAFQTVTGFAVRSTSISSSDNLHHFPPGKIDGKASKIFRILSPKLTLSEISWPSGLLEIDTPFTVVALTGIIRRRRRTLREGGGRRRVGDWVRRIETIGRFGSDCQLWRRRREGGSAGLMVKVEIAIDELSACSSF